MSDVTTQELPELLDAKTAAEYLRCSEATVESEAAAGRLRGAKIGTGWVFLPSDVLDYLKLRIEEKQAEVAKKKGEASAPLQSPGKGRRAPPSLDQ